MKTRRGWFKALLFFAFLSIMTTSNPVHAAGPWYVATNGNDTNDCLGPGPAHACATISGALGKADPGDTIYVASGTYTSIGNEVVLLNKDATLSGGWDGTFTAQDGDSTIDAEGSRRGITVTGGVTATVDRFIIENGFTSSDGGGIRNEGTLTLTYSIVTHNTVVGSFVDGGGIENLSDLTLNNTSVRDNSATDSTGGGIHNGGNLVLNNSAVSGNSSRYGGGGIESYGTGTLNLNNSTISDNTAGGNGGGGIGINGGVISLHNSTVSSNEGSNSAGGGIRNNGGTVTLHNSIIAGNMANSSPDCGGGSVGSSGYNLIGDTSDCTFASSTGDVTDVDVKIGPLIGSPGYHSLSASSPAVDAGNPAGCTDHLGAPLSTDQRGAARVGRCDIGAYEYTTPGAATIIYPSGGTPQHAAPLRIFKIPLQAVVLDSIGSGVDNLTVTFVAPTSGASGTFADSGTNTTTSVTDEFGVAIAATLTANGLTGNYTVDATVGAVGPPAQFLLTNVVWYVSTGGDDGNDCESPASTCATINGALGKAGFAAGDTVFVAAGTYTGTGSEVVLIDKDVTLSGGWEGSFTTQNGTTTIDGQGSRRGVEVSSGVDSIIEDFVIQNGTGGILNDGGTLTLDKVVVIGNDASGRGGGIRNYGGDLTVNNSDIKGNTADEGGGLSNEGIAILNQCTVSGNTANVSGGGGITNRGSSMTLNGTTVSGNSTIGGVQNGPSGGGIYTSSDMIVINSTISGNMSTSTGGGIFNYGGHVYLNNSTVSNNSAASPGGGIYNNSGSISSAIVTLQNSIIAGNTSSGPGPDCVRANDTLGYNLIGDTSDCLFSPTSGDLTNIDPLLGPLQDNGGSTYTHTLLYPSPAIDAGNPAGCEDFLGNPLENDQRGAPRFDRCDIGAYEEQYFKTVDEDVAMPGDTLRYAISFWNWLDTPRPYTVTDTLPAELTYVNGTLSATSGTPSYSAGVINWSDSVSPGQEVTINFDAQVGAVVGEIINEVEINDSVDTETRSATVSVDAPVCSVTKYAGNPVLHLGTPGSWDDDGIWHPAVLLDGSTYKMWYAGNDDTYVNHIGLATSPDGYVWTKEGSNPILSPTETWETAGVSRPSVILDGSTYKMWFTGVDSSGVIQIGYATSPDGIAWTKHPGNPVLAVGAADTWEDEDVTGPTVLKDNGGYHMWYGGNDGSTFRIGHATSGDGITWVKDPANPVLDVGDVGDWDWLGIYSPDVVKVGSSYKLWYSGETLPQAWQTGYAESTDGSNWTRKGLMIPEGPPGTFDTNSADHPAVLIDGSSFRVWYAGIDDSYTYTIGHAEAQLCTGGAYSLYLPLVMKDYSPAPPCPPDYADDFSDPSSGWFIFEDGDVKYDYTGGEYQIWLKNPAGDDGRWVTPGAKASDFTVAVSARRTSGTEGAYGVLFGISPDWTELYEVSIDQNFYDIWRYDSGWTWLAGGTSPDIQTGTNWNRIKVTREGTGISLWINDQFQTTVNDGSFTGFRRIGLSAYSPTGSALDARFDDFALYPASCGPIAADTQGLEWGEAEAHQEIIPPKPETPE